MSVRAIQAGKAVILIQATDLTGQTLQRIANNMKRFGATLTRVGEQSMRGGLLGGIATGMTLRNFFKFDDLMKELRAKFGFLGDMTLQQANAMKLMEQRIRSLGKTTSYTSQEVAEASVVLAQGGLAPTEVANSLQAILDLGRGTRTALDMAANMYVRAMRAFNLSSEDANATVSQFVRATRYGVLELSDLESGLRYSSGTAATLGQNLAPILAILTELSNVGLAGSIGGTSLNTAMANLVKKMEKIKEKFPGFEPATKNGDLDLLRTLERLYAYTSKLSKMERIEVFQDLFNLRGARAIAGAQGIENILGMAKAIEKAGNEARLAANLMDSGPGGSWRKLTSAIDDLSLSLGKAAEGPLVAIIHAATHMANAFNRVVETNKPFATMLVLSPVIAVAAGVGFIALGKSIAALGTAFGVATVGFRKFLGMLSGGTVRQWIALKGTFQALRGGSVAHMGLRQMAGGLGASRFGIGGAIRSQATVLRSGMTARKAATNMAIYKRQADFLKAINHNPALQSRYMYLYRRQRSVRDAALMSQRLARGGRGTALRSIIPSMGRGLLEVVKGLKNFSVATLRVLWATRRLIPSWFTLLEIFVLFGDKIPGMSNVWNQFANGFTAAGKAIGRIASYLQGPLSLIATSFEALYKGETARGLNGLATALSGIYNIIVNQLVSAWNLFKASIASTWDTIKVVFLAITQLVENLIESIGNVLGLVSGVAGATIGGFFSGGSFGDTLIAGAQSFMKGINQLFYWGDMFVFNLKNILLKLLSELGLELGKLVSAIMGVSFFDHTLENIRDTEMRAADNQYKVDTKRREKLLESQNKEVDRVFQSIKDRQTQKDALLNAQQRESWSANINKFTGQMAQEMQAYLNRPETPVVTGNNDFQPERSYGLGKMPVAMDLSKQVAGSLIGYISEVSSNRLKFGDNMSKKQLKALEDIRDNTADLKDRAETFE